MQVQEAKKSTSLQDAIRTFYIEITNACNFACTFCPYPKMDRKKGVMDLGLFRKVADEVSEKEICSWICVHLMGEPTLHPQFFDMVRYLNEKNLYVSLITNGSLPAERLAAGFQDLEIASLFLSINSFGEDKYTEKGVKGMDYEAYVENQKNFIDLYAPSHPNTPIYISYLLTKDKYMAFNSRQVDTDEEALDVLHYWMDYAAKFNAVPPPPDETPKFPSKSAALDRLPLLTFEDLEGGLDFTESVFRIAPNLFVTFKSAGTWHNQLLDEGLTVKKRVRGTCEILDTEFAVLWNGDTTFCCGDYEGKMQLGNVRDHSIEEILNSEKVQRIRDDNRRMIFNQEVCQVCKGDVYQEDGKKVEVEKTSLLDKFRIAKDYYARLGARRLVRKIASKLAPDIS